MGAALKKLVASGLLSQDGQRFTMSAEKKKELRKPPPKPKKKKKKPAKKKTKKKKKKKTKKKLTYSDMATKAVLNTRHYGKGMSRQAIKKYIETNFSKVVQNSALRAALKKLVASGLLSQDGQRFTMSAEKKKELRKPPPKPKK